MNKEKEAEKKKWCPLASPPPPDPLPPDESRFLHSCPGIRVPLSRSSSISPYPDSSLTAAILPATVQDYVSWNQERLENLDTRAAMEKPSFIRRRRMIRSRWIYTTPLLFCLLLFLHLLLCVLLRRHGHHILLLLPALLYLLLGLLSLLLLHHHHHLLHHCVCVSLLFLISFFKIHLYEIVLVCKEIKQ